MLVLGAEPEVAAGLAALFEGLAGALKQDGRWGLPAGLRAASFFSERPAAPLFHCPPHMHP